jgi:very-short-patch-repair endonuclease
VGHLDGKIGSRLFVEVDGLQHAEEWSGPGASSFENDHDRDILTYLATGARTIRITYRQLEQFWPQCLAAIERAYNEHPDA